MSEILCKIKILSKGYEYNFTSNLGLDYLTVPESTQKRKFILSKEKILSIILSIILLILGYTRHGYKIEETLKIKIQL